MIKNPENPFDYTVPIKVEASFLHGEVMITEPEVYNPGEILDKIKEQGGSFTSGELIEYFVRKYTSKWEFRNWPDKRLFNVVNLLADVVCGDLEGSGLAEMTEEFRIGPQGGRPEELRFGCFV